MGATEAGGVPGPSFSEERLVVSVVLEAVPVVISRATDGSGFSDFEQGTVVSGEVFALVKSSILIKSE